MCMYLCVYASGAHVCKNTHTITCAFPTAAAAAATGGDDVRVLAAAGETNTGPPATSNADASLSYARECLCAFVFERLPYFQIRSEHV